MFAGQDDLKNKLFQLVDSHCHIDRCDLNAFGFTSPNDFIEAGLKNNIVHMLCVCVDLPYFEPLLALAESHKNLSCSVGAHPADPHDPEPTVEILECLGSRSSKVIAVGETGLDYYHCKGDVTWQKDRFRNHIRAAKSLKKPLIIHTREAKADTLEILKQEKADQIGGVLHCFTEDLNFAKAAMDLGFYISFSGIVTFKNAQNLQDVAKNIPKEYLLVETDAPYLTPVPHRGKPNQPAYVRHVAEFLAELRGESLLDLAAQTTENFKKLFRIDF